MDVGLRVSCHPKGEDWGMIGGSFLWFRGSKVFIACDRMKKAGHENCVFFPVWIGFVPSGIRM